MRLPDLASIFTAEIWVIIKALKQIKDCVASRYIFVSPCFTIYEVGTSLDLDGDTKVCLFKLLPIKTLFYKDTPDTLTLWVMKKLDSAAKSALDLLLVKVGVP